MKKYIPISLLVLAIACLCGGIVYFWRESAVKMGTVGIIDIEKVSVSMGWAGDMRRSIQDVDKQWRAQVDAHLKPSRDAYESKLKEVAAAMKPPVTVEAIKGAKQTADLEAMGLSKAQITDITRIAMSFAQEVNAANTRMNQTMQSFQQALVTACSQAAEPAIRRVAVANHRSVILSPTAGLLYRDESADLTDKVVDDLQHATQVKVVFPDPPQLDLRPQPPPATQPH
jgi:hypothetical protein